MFVEKLDAAEFNRKPFVMWLQSVASKKSSASFLQTPQFGERAPVVIIQIRGAPGRPLDGSDDFRPALFGKQLLRRQARVARRALSAGLRVRNARENQNYRETTD